jgi:ABC-type transporter Mla subunit MlaD
MTAKPFKFRHVNEIAGAFTVTVLVMLVGLIFVSGRLQGWFERKRFYDVVLPESGTYGIRAGSEVRVMGARAGAVRTVQLRHRETGKTGHFLDEDPRKLQLVAVLELRGDHTVFIGEDSKVFLRTGLGGLGASYLEISRSDVPAPDRRVLPLADPSASAQADMTELLEEIRDVVVPAIRQFEATSKQVELLAASLGDPEREFQVTLRGVKELVAEVNKGESAAGIFLRDPVTGEELKTAVASFSKSSETLAELLAALERGEGAAGMLLTDEAAQQELAEILANVARAAESANETLALLTTVAGSLPDTVRSTDAAISEYTDVARTLEETAREYEIVGEALQRHWLLRKFVRREENPVAVPRGGTASPETEVAVSGRSPGGAAAPLQSVRGEEPPEKKGLFRGWFGGSKDEAAGEKDKARRPSSAPGPRKHP